MFCGFCGSTIPDDSETCPVCGKRTGMTMVVDPNNLPENLKKYFESSSQQKNQQQGYQQPNGAPAQPAPQQGYRQPYGAPAQPAPQQGYQQPYGAPAQPAPQQGYRQPYGAPAQPAPQQGYQQRPYGTPNQGYQQPRYGTPVQQAQPRQPYGAPAQQPAPQQGYRHPYGAPAQQGYRQPYGAPARQNYQAERPAGKTLETVGKIGGIAVTVLAALAAAAGLVAAIVWIVDIVQGIGDLSKMKSMLNKTDYNNSLFTLIMYLADNVVRFICLVIAVLLYAKKKYAGAGGAMIVFTVPTLPFLFSDIFGFKLFGIKYSHSFKTAHMIAVFLFIAAIVLFLVALANKSADKTVRMILAGITGALLIATLILTIVVYSDFIKVVNSALRYSSGTAKNEYAKIHTEYVFAFLTMLFAILAMMAAAVVGVFFSGNRKKAIGR